jgi:hypothetical protein
MISTRRGFLVAATAALAGCNVLPEESEPIEASATAPAELPESSDYSLVTAAEQTIETTVTVDLSGDVQVTNQQDVVATIFQRMYEGPDGRRFGLLTAPAVTVLEQQDITRDPVAALDEARQVALATDTDVESVADWSEDGAATLLGTETTRMATTATVGGSEQRLARLRVPAGEDSVTAIATVPDEATPPFGDVVRNT